MPAVVVSLRENFGLSSLEKLASRTSSRALTGFGFESKSVDAHVHVVVVKDHVTNTPHSQQMFTCLRGSPMFNISPVHRYHTVGQGRGFFSVMSHVNGRDF